MDRWFAYIQERFPQILWGAMALGIAFSGNALNGSRLQFIPLILVFIGTWLFFFLLRLMNDLKDLDKDRLANPDNALPRGLLEPKEVRKVIYVLQIVLFAFSQLLLITLQGTAAAFYLLLAVFAWLYYNDFYIRRLLERYPFVKTFLNDLFAIPLAFFAVAASQPDRVFGVKAWGFAVALFGAFYVFDMCRKLNPHSHPVLAAPIHFYGYNKTFAVIVIMLIISAIGAYAMGVALLLWAIDIVVLVALIAVYINSEAYKAPDLAATVSLLLHTWAGLF